ncbi:macro domain-containing protein [Streptomyces sp. SHP 1-2]|uniref:macro domain-containing protein n=1 Tax=Streptomyces sp. SHP 1-2 TaxID=2769489 RepID=UPI00223808B2|nr:macro domain-containing protein [Streptomyces sp. SHP 1-2]MCW5251251.1 macro domain-containing protein [Streptomyces sp. SHP 1-2]
MAPPSLEHASVLAELQVVRRAGPLRLRGRDDLPLLEAAAAGLTATRTREGAVEALLRHAVERLDPGTLRTAAEYTLGLAQGTRDWPASSRRARAAEVYRVSVERFRKHHEVMVLGQVAEHIVELVEGGGEPDGVDREGATHRTLDVLAGDRGARLTLHIHPVDLLRDLDVVVSPVNTHFALPESYKSSVSASLRRAASVRGVTGDLLDDPVHDELRTWAARHATGGRPVLPGTVAATGSGALAGSGVRRIYHAAVAVPRAGTNDYDVLPADVTRATSRALALLAEEHARYAPPLRSVCFPLLGSGRGGLPYRVSAAAVWSAVEAELARGARWDVHFVGHTPEAARAVERIAAGTRPGRARPAPGRSG